MVLVKHSILTMFTTIENSIERIFFPLNVDENCRLISRLLHPYKLQIYNYLESGENDKAIAVYLLILQAIFSHFEKDKHYLYIDKYYLPEIDCKDINYWFKKKIANGTFTDLTRIHVINNINASLHVMYTKYYDISIHSKKYNL